MGQKIKSTSLTHVHGSKYKIHTANIRAHRSKDKIHTPNTRAHGSKYKSDTRSTRAEWKVTYLNFG